MARYGVPILLWGRSDFEGNHAVFTQYITPWVYEFNWRQTDHVVGLGTTINHEVLDRLGVPRWKQHILEVHRDVLHAVGASFPRLRGRVIVVDDLHEGETPLGVARLYRGDVVNTEPGQSCSYLFESPQPLADICDGGLWLLYRDGAVREVYHLAREVDREFMAAGRKASWKRRRSGSRPLRVA